MLYRGPRAQALVYGRFGPQERGGEGGHSAECGHLHSTSEPPDSCLILALVFRRFGRLLRELGAPFPPPILHVSSGGLLSPSLWCPCGTRLLGTHLCRIGVSGGTPVTCCRCWYPPSSVDQLHDQLPPLASPKLGKLGAKISRFGREFEKYPPRRATDWFYLTVPSVNARRPAH